ncbi:MAG: protein kinase, partial [Acidobacteriota bacterium]|nr:protein kinase [Acidobacteriota bacterium]
IDARTDVWSLGVVISEMVTGRLPFEGPTTNDVIAAVLEREPPPLMRHVPEVPTELQRIVKKALCKNREERYQTAKDLYIDLKNLKQDLEFEAKQRESAPDAPQL